MTQVICSAVQSAISDSKAESHLHTAIDDMVNQLDNEANGAFVHYKSNVTVDTHPTDDFSNERDYIEACLEEIDEKGELWDGDAWIIADGYDKRPNKFGYGYGNVSYHNSDGEMAVGARVLHTPSQWVVVDPIETFYNLAIHEAAHNLGADHEHGIYQSSDDLIRDVSPMATSYTYEYDDIGDEFDTCWAGGSTPPSSFCKGVPNHAADGYCGGSTGCKDECRHSTKMSDCTISVIESNYPI